jgi:hypothetical protein
MSTTTSRVQGVIGQGRISRPPIDSLGAMRGLLIGPALFLAGRRAYRLCASGAVTVDTGIGRRARALGPVTWAIAADREAVFDVIASPYLGKTPRSMRDHLHVWERGTDMVLAEHLTHVECGVTSTLETVRFDRPSRIDFRLVRGPVPHVRESFVLDSTENGSTLTWEGELGTDFGAVGSVWGGIVARSWEKAVRSSMEAIITEAERRSRAPA